MELLIELVPFHVLLIKIMFAVVVFVVVGGL